MIRYTLFLATLLASPACMVAQDSPSYPPPPPGVNSIVALAPEGEPGVQLVITGTVYEKDKKTPVRDLLMYLYQVDATGEYHGDPSTRIPRLNGWLKTDKNGRYEIRTIRPSSYPNSRVVAHIHSFVKFPDGRRTWIQDFLFHDDPHLSSNAKETARKEGRFSRILQTSWGEKGILQAARDIVVEN